MEDKTIEQIKSVVVANNISRATAYGNVREQMVIKVASQANAVLLGY